jgi:hypothetical protein
VSKKIPAPAEKDGVVGHGIPRKSNRSSAPGTISHPLIEGIDGI